MRIPILLATAAVITAQSLPPGVTKGPSLAGVSEYNYPNGLKVLLYPDGASPKITVNMTYLVGSRHEGYGESGMAHLLEHMNFIETTNGRKIKAELDGHGASWNGSTNDDRTNYYETVLATDDNLRWALGLEADRMTNVRMAKELLDTEMTVVRNEFERRENDANSILQERVASTAYLWHNYGKSTIGSREDIERVPIERLEAFYKKYYQPDNAVLILSGRIDESKALAMVAETVGRVPRPARKLDQTYTVEPPQDGERFVELRRVGQNKSVVLAFHGPAAGHPDSQALQVLAGIMSGGGGGGRGGGGGAEGRLNKAVVDSRKANSISMRFQPEHDPGLIMINANLSVDQSPDDVKKATVDTLAAIITEPPTRDEIERVKTRLLRTLDQQMSDSQNFALRLSEPVADGDWRIAFVAHDRLKEVTADDVVRVAKLYLKASNRTVGYFTPEEAPDRTVVPEVANLERTLATFKTDFAVTKAETFDPTPANIEAHIQRAHLDNGMRLAVLNKTTANSTVRIEIQLHFGDPATLAGKSAAAQLVGALIMRGTKNRTRQQLQEEMTKLDAQISVGGGPGTAAVTLEAMANANAAIQVPAKNFEAAMKLAAEILREPSFPESDFDQLRTQRVRALERKPTEPTQMAPESLARDLSPWKPGDPMYGPEREAALDEMRKLTLDDVMKFHERFYGASRGELIAVGPLDLPTVQRVAQATLGSWTAAGPYTRIVPPYRAAAPTNQKIETPDKANAQFEAGIRIRMNDMSPDYPALVLANYMLGGSAASRLPDRIRNREGLSYSVGTRFSAPAEGDSAVFSMVAISNPTNTPKVEASFKDELARTLREGFGADELDKAKQAFRDARLVDRSQDSALVSLIALRERTGLTLLRDRDMDAKLEAVTLDQVNAAFRRYVDPAAISIVKAGDFQAAGAYK